MWRFATSSLPSQVEKNENDENEAHVQSEETNDSHDTTVDFTLSNDYGNSSNTTVDYSMELPIAHRRVPRLKRKALPDDFVSN